MIAARQSQGHFVRLRPSRDEANARELGRRSLEDASSELLLRLVRELVVVDVGEEFGLPRGRFYDVATAVTEDGDHRAASAGVQELAPVDAVEANALAPLDVGIHPVRSRGKTFVRSAVISASAAVIKLVREDARPAR